MNCLGTGNSDDNVGQRNSRPCCMCLGAGVLRNDISCRCGRPIILYFISGGFGCAAPTCKGWKNMREVKEFFPKCSALELEQLRQATDRGADCQDKETKNLT